jgi:hypothetical protein
MVAPRPAAPAAEQKAAIMSHLESIAARQRKGLVRDALFAALVALATIVSISTVGTAVEASSVVAHR